MAYALKAFARPRKVKTPAHLLQIMMLYCGLDQALQTTAGSFTLLEERITDTAIHRRLRACGPWLKALLQTLLPATQTPLTLISSADLHPPRSLEAAVSGNCWIGDSGSRRL
ncbi:hypothetical protein [Thiocystis violacea]|uniref:hypothetical protein n=1 Tax=Thiocystis violacea TaxID=13725 RepID=UPI001A91E408|nr:hypothetical protein [Thiocystis violacea]MBK1725229.1 hypothetical protein [Thiocystis violacea]